MPLPDPARRLDPQRALAQDPLAAPLLATEGQASALEHLRARDPRARLEQAARALHGSAQGLPASEPLPEAERPRRHEL